MDRKIAVIGSTFVDCKGFADGVSGAYDAFGRNTGRVRFVHGGVGRNIAENLAGLGQKVVFVSTLDHSDLGQAVQARLAEEKVDLRFVEIKPEKGMGFWMVILNPMGEQVGSLSQMPDVSLLEQLLEHRGQEIFQEVEGVALEIDLSVQVSKKVLELAEQFHKPVFALPGNLSILQAHPEFLSRLSGFICNQIEAKKLFGIEVETLSIAQYAEKLVDITQKWKLPLLIVTLGAQGAVYYDTASGLKGSVPAIATQVKDVSGAGDAFFSGTVAALFSGKPLAAAVEVGTRLASLTIQSEENCCQEIYQHKKILL